MTRRPPRICAAFLSACVWVGVLITARADSPAPGPATYVVAPTGAKRVKATLAVEIMGPKLQADEWTVYAAQVPTLPGQIDVHTALFPRGKVARELSDDRRAMLYARVPVVGAQGRQNLSTRLEYEVTLLERRLQPRDLGVPSGPAYYAPLDPKTRRRELASGHQFDYQSPSFQAWLDEQKLRREPDEDEVSFARRAFAALRKGLSHYEGADAEHTASKVCAAGKSDFAGLTAVYVAVVRANGIPARALFGFPVIFEGRPNTTFWPHAKAEFYAPGVGWVPADLAGAIRMNSPGDGLDFFGHDRADFLTTHLDTDLLIDTYFGRKTVEWLPDISWWVKGSGTSEGTQARVTLTVEVEPIDLAEPLAPKPPQPRAGRPSANGRQR